MSDTESYFNKQDLKELMVTLKAHDIPCSRTSSNDIERAMTLKLNKYLYLYFYNNYQEKQYSVVFTPNMYRCHYLNSYTNDITKIIKIIKANIHKKCIPFENAKGQDRKMDIIVRETEEILNELGIESEGSNYNNIYLQHGYRLKIVEKFGICNFKLHCAYHNKYSIPEKNIIDVLEIGRIYKKIYENIEQVCS